MAEYNKEISEARERYIEALVSATRQWLLQQGVSLSELDTTALEHVMRGAIA